MKMIAVKANLFLALLLISLMTCECHFSMGYIHGASKSPIVNAGMEMLSMPDAAHVADLYARLSGMSPLLSSGNFGRHLLSESECSLTHRTQHSPHSILFLSHHPRQYS